MRTMNFSLNNNCIKLVAIGIKLDLQKFVILRVGVYDKDDFFAHQLLLNPNFAYFKRYSSLNILDLFFIPYMNPKFLFKHKNNLGLTFIS